MENNQTLIIAFLVILTGMFLYKMYLDNDQTCECKCTKKCKNPNCTCKDCKCGDNCQCNKLNNMFYNQNN